MYLHEVYWMKRRTRYGVAYWEPPPRVGNIETYWDAAPPELSDRCNWWVERIQGGWRRNRRLRGLGYHEACEYYGVYLWEYLNILSPLFDQCPLSPIEIGGEG